MVRNKRAFQNWGRYFWGKRERHPDIDALFDGPETIGFGHGLYFIGCGNRIVYIGVSVNLPERSLQSLSNVYHHIPDIELPWSIAFACDETGDPENDAESSAIRKFAPIFNTSIPSVKKSRGLIPKIRHIARVFDDQSKNCDAFETKNMKEQMKEAEVNQSPPWQKGFSKRKILNPTTNE